MSRDITVTLTGEEFNEVYTAIKDVHEAMSSIPMNEMDDNDFEQLVVVESALAKFGEDLR